MAKILVVDDEKNIADMIGDWLIEEKHDATVVYNGIDCCRHLDSNEFNLVILDWDLPDLKGIDILRRHRESGGTTPVIMLTAHKSIDDKGLGLDLGADDYMTKPFHMKELTSRIGAVLRRSNAAPPPPKPLGTGNEEVLASTNLVGTALAGRYEFIEVIGEGGFAVVCKARHPQLDKLVAIKMLQPEAVKKEEVLARFEREARAISQLDHQNIIIVHDYGVTERGQPYMVMEYIDGKSLSGAVKESKYLPLAQGLDILVQSADGLMHAHEEGILHRDIKPSNVMLKHAAGKPIVPKLLDFGLARFKDPKVKGDVGLTKERQVMGSIPYMSPEQITSKPFDERSDLYSFGCLLFNTLTGYHPHAGESVAETLMKHIQEAPYTFEEVRPELTFPDDLKGLYSMMLEKDPANRLQTMREVRDLLKIIRSRLQQPAPPAPPG